MWEFETTRDVSIQSGRAGGRDHDNLTAAVHWNSSRACQYTIHSHKNTAVRKNGNNMYVFLHCFQPTSTTDHLANYYCRMSHSRSSDVLQISLHFADLVRRMSLFDNTYYPTIWRTTACSFCVVRCCCCCCCCRKLSGTRPPCDTSLLL